MNIRSRVARLTRRTAADRSAGPLTVFLGPAAAAHPPGRRAVWDGAGVEIVYDPATGPPQLPPGGPHKLVLNAAPGLADLI